MTAPAALSAVDDPDELAELTRSLPALDGAARHEAMLSIDGIHCAGCVVKIEQALHGWADEIAINVLTRRARLVFRPTHQPLSSLLQRIAQLGYQPRPLSRTALALIPTQGLRSSLWHMLLAVFCMMQIMMYAWPRYIAGPDELAPDTRQLLIWAEWLLTVPVLLLACGPFFQRAWRDLRARQVGMDVPIALGILVTFVASTLGAAQQGEVWFDSLTMFVAFLLLGRWLEARARERAVRGVTDLMAALPEMVERRNHDGSFHLCPVRQIKLGDEVRIAPGHAIPADGVLISPHARLDEALLTGESTPCARTAGELLHAGSLNLDGPVTLRVTRRVQDSRLAQIVELVERAATSKPRLAQLADRWARWFTLAVLILAGTSALVWWFIEPSKAWWVAASVLIVTCPCALSLATPATMLAASAQLARQGILLRAPQSLETLAYADTFVFDKTGTLTTTQWASAAATAPPHPLHLVPQDAHGVACALAAGSTHPIAQAIIRSLPAGQTPPPVRAVHEQRGQGLRGEVWLAGCWRSARVGHADFVAMHRAKSDPTRAPGVWLSVDEHVCAHLAVHEALRPDAVPTVAALQAAGLRVHMLSGDQAQSVAARARELGIAVARAQASPEDKLTHMRALQQAGHCVVMIGDGINDAPVLAQADLSITFAHSATLAQCHADLLILHEQLQSVVTAYQLARRTLRIVRQNLGLAATYNGICIPLALMGMMPPWLAGLGMALSSLLVVLNALRLAPHPDKAPLTTPT